MAGNSNSGRKAKPNARRTSVILDADVLQYLKATENVSGTIENLVRGEMKRTYSNLQDLTRHEAGAVLYGNGEIWIGNWSSINGIPRELDPLGTIGLGEELNAAPCAVPPTVKQAMIHHERENGGDGARSGYHAWQVNDVIVVVQDAWN